MITLSYLVPFWYSETSLVTLPLLSFIIVSTRELSLTVTFVVVEPSVCLISFVTVPDLDVEIVSIKFPSKSYFLLTDVPSTLFSKAFIGLLSRLYNTWDS